MTRQSNELIEQIEAYERLATARDRAAEEEMVHVSVSTQDLKLILDLVTPWVYEDPTTSHLLVRSGKAAIIYDELPTDAHEELSALYALELLLERLVHSDDGRKRILTWLVNLLDPDSYMSWSIKDEGVDGQ